MRVTFTYEHVNLLLSLIGALIIFYVISMRTQNKRAIRFGNYKLIEKISGGHIFEKNYLPLILRIIAIILIILSISNFSVVVDQLVSKSDFVIAIDTSSSMLTPDLTPNRLEAAKIAAVSLIKRVPHGTNIGIVSFAGKAYVRSPLTDNKDELIKTIKNITFDVPAGTSTSDALITSTILLQNSTRKRTIILITDGQNNIGPPMETAIKYVKNWNVTINAIGIGSNYTYNSTGLNVSAYIMDNATIAEPPKLNATWLENITNITGGRLLLPQNNTDLINSVYKSVLRPDKIKISFDTYLLIAAAVILVIEWALGATTYRTIP